MLLLSKINLQAKIINIYTIKQEKKYEGMLEISSF